eukprot:198418-Chlamydomonas_euryale.AAC.1
MEASAPHGQRVSDTFQQYGRVCTWERAFAAASLHMNVLLLNVMYLGAGGGDGGGRPGPAVLQAPFTA